MGDYFSRALIKVLLATLITLLPITAFGWKPYTHNTSAWVAYQDAIDGEITINDNSYLLPAGLANALSNWPEFYNAGVVGPDGFPDLTYGQSIIHPESTGKWLKHILKSAWSSQSDSSYTPAQKEQILAFAYGYLTHAAGDMWAHTLVNDFAGGTFPGVADILTSLDAAGIAARHLIVEGYIGDATPGFDGYQDDVDPRLPRAPAPFGDTSDDSTQNLPYDAPHKFIYDALINPASNTPLPDRGPLIDFFLDLDGVIAALIIGTPDPLEDAINAYDNTLAALMDLEEDCKFDDLSDVIACPLGLAELGITAVVDSLEAFYEVVTDTAAAAVATVWNSYLNAWLDDIDKGLHNWGKLGLALTRALFDPQSRRNLQNDDCDPNGDGDPAESTLIRAQCEDGVGLIDTVLNEADDYINDYALSMLGAPDLVGDVRSILGDLFDNLDSILDTVLRGPLNPLRETKAQISAYIDSLIKRAMEEVLGVDIDQLHLFLTQSNRFICLSDAVFDLPQPLGMQSIDLFVSGEHDRLDDIIFLAGDHHVDDASLPEGCGRLGDDSELKFQTVKGLKNTILTAKLLLLDGSQMNKLLSDNLDGRTINTYDESLPKEGNIMITALGNDQVAPWLTSIDSDHSWRSDGSPRFPGEPSGGDGTFPLWESCVLRPVFRKLYSDWETNNNFPDLGDDVSADPDNDPNPPVSTLALSGTTYSDGTTTWIGADNQFTLSAIDLPIEKAFPSDELLIRLRVNTDPANPDAWQSTMQGEMFSLQRADGRYYVDYQSADPCHNFDNSPDFPENVQTTSVVIDTTPPKLICNTPPFDATYDSDDVFTLDFDVDDGVDGSGVASTSATVDGYLDPSGTRNTVDGDALDMFNFYPGDRSVFVRRSDNIGNEATDPCGFEMHATAESLITSLTRFRDMGKITDPMVYDGLLDKLVAAKKKHRQRKHATEHNILSAFISEIEAQYDKSVTPDAADRLIAWAFDIIASGG